MSTPQPACRGNCGVPLDPALVEPDGDGLHPTCKEPIGPVIPHLARVLARHDASRPRSTQAQLGPSQIGEPCDRALAYRAFGIPPARGEGLKWAPLLGTWAHAGIATALAEENRRLSRERYLIERRVVVSESLGITGNCDAYDTDRDEVIDWKLVGMTALKRYAAHGPGEVYRVQAHLYGLGWTNQGLNPASVRVVFLPKWSACITDGLEWAEPYNHVIADDALRRLQRVIFLGSTVALDQEPRNFALIPGDDTGEACTYCNWRRPGGPADATGCPGDTAEVLDRATAKFADGLI